MPPLRAESPFSRQLLDSLVAGDSLLIGGIIYAARDAAHRRLTEMIEIGKPLPVELDGQTVYYMGPSPTPPGKVIGSCGPTTSRRMDAYTPALLQKGLLAMIGKGERSEPVKKAIQKHGAVYLVATGGIGALLANCVKKAESAAFEDLGPEAILRLEVENFPAIVAYDKRGGDLFQREIARYALDRE
jgi:fumarate hydratase subunit beta